MIGQRHHDRRDNQPNQQHQDHAVQDAPPQPDGIVGRVSSASTNVARRSEPVMTRCPCRTVTSLGFLAIDHQDPGVDCRALVQRRADRPVQAVLQVEDAAVLHDVRKRSPKNVESSASRASRSSVRLVVTSSSSRTGRGGSAAQSLGVLKPWSG